MLVITGLILLYFKKINKRQILILGLVGIALIPISSIYKYYFLTGETMGELQIGDARFLFSEILRGEFESASRNLQVLISNKSVSRAVMGGQTIISDILRIFGYAPNSSIVWFQNRFFSSEAAGQGFTLIGEGYINFGYFGVVLVYAITALILRIIYKNSNKNLFNLFVYFCSIPIFIYANRADLANIFTPLVRQVLTVFIVVYIFSSKSKKLKATGSMEGK